MTVSIPDEKTLTAFCLKWSWPHNKLILCGITW
jgi:hypothetical protein